MDRSTVLKELAKLSPKYGFCVKSGKAWIRCPFHGRNGQLERSPSCVINLEGSLRFKTGNFHCFGCNETGSWNKLAEKLGLALVDEDSEEKELTYMSSDDRKQLFEEDDNDIELNSVDWDPNVNWRGIKGKLITELGGQLCYNPYLDDTQLFLPVKMNQVQIGGIFCILERKSHKQQGYINTKGQWSSEALFPFDYVRKKFNTNYIFLVEGPRDALNLIQHGLPALAIIGSQSWNSYKANVLISQGYTTCVLAFDPDTAGEKACSRVKKLLKPHMKIVRLNMKEGTDPADITKNKAIKLKMKIEETS